MSWTLKMGRLEGAAGLRALWMRRCRGQNLQTAGSGWNGWAEVGSGEISVSITALVRHHQSLKAVGSGFQGLAFLHRPLLGVGGWSLISPSG